MDVLKIKNLMKSKGITYEELSTMSNIPLNTLKNIFRGKTQNPRIDTVQAIEKALGLDKSEDIAISAEDRELIELIKQLSDEETKELSNFVDFIIAKRK